VKPVYVQNIFKVYKPGEQLLTGQSVRDWVQERGMVMVGYSAATSWPHLLPPLQDPHVTAIAQRLGKTPSQVLHRWSLQHGVGVIPKSVTPSRIEENFALFDFSLGPVDVALLDGLATLSETGAEEYRPAWLHDVYVLQQRIVPQATAAVPEPLASGEFANRGFNYPEIEGSLLYQPADRTPEQCREICQSLQQCRAWEVCVPYDPQKGCNGCYLVGSVPRLVSAPGWHANIERPTL